MFRTHTTQRSAAVCAAALLVIAAAGCHKGTTAKPVTTKPKAPAQVSEIDLKTYKPNEAGAIMIVMYHKIQAGKNDDMNRTPEQFQKDLQTFYDRKYYPVTVGQIVKNDMDVPAGWTPIAITFDDAWQSQFNVIDGSKIDPQCGIGILEAFQKSHPEWKKVTATFFILPKEGRNPEPFTQDGSVPDKLKFLQEHGYEIGDHTATHDVMSGMSADKVRWEIATPIKDIKAVNSAVDVESLSIPYGRLPRDKAAQAALVSGSASGVKYQMKAVVMAAWRPVMSPNAKAGKSLNHDTIAVFNPYHLERCKPNPAQANMPGTIEYWLAYFEKNPTLRYVSDGNKDVVAVPAGLKSMVDDVKIKSEGKALQLYGAGGSSGSGGGGGLSL